MKQNITNDNGQVFYLDRWVDKENFRVFVYNKEGQKITNSYEEYELAINSGLWFESKDLINPRKGKKLNANSASSNN